MSPRFTPNGTSVLDVGDPDSFVRSCIKRSRIKPENPDTYEELVCEGIAILFELADKYDPERDGGIDPELCEGTDGVASFAGYAWYLLPLRLVNAWHRMHPNHVLTTVTAEDGSKKRVWVYYDEPASIEERQQVHPEYLDYERHRRAGEFVAVPHADEAGAGTPTASA